MWGCRGWHVRHGCKRQNLEARNGWWIAAWLPALAVSNGDASFTGKWRFVKRARAT